MNTYVLSGPKAAESQVRTALAAAGFEVQRTIDDHGLPDAQIEEGRDAAPPQPVAFVTVTASDDQLDAVAATASTLSYVLRMHHETPEPAPPSGEQAVAEKLADLQAQIDALRG
jgi:hypothetical protein